MVYTINPGGGVSPWKIRVNQAWDSEQWATIGTFAMQNGGSVDLTNQSSAVDTAGRPTTPTTTSPTTRSRSSPRAARPGTPIGGPPGVQDEPKGSNPAWVQLRLRRGAPPATRSTPRPATSASTFTDLATPGRGMPLDFTRTYAEAHRRPGRPERGARGRRPVRLGLDLLLQPVTRPPTRPPANVTITQEDGSQVAFTDAGGVYTTSAPRYDATLTKSGRNLHLHPRAARRCSPSTPATGRLTAETDLAGHQGDPAVRDHARLRRSGQLSTITDPAGRAYTLTWTGGHITARHDSAGPQVSYAYDAAGNLTDVYGVGTTRTPTLQDNDHATVHLHARAPDDLDADPEQLRRPAPAPVTGDDLRHRPSGC